MNQKPAAIQTEARDKSRGNEVIGTVASAARALAERMLGKLARGKGAPDLHSALEGRVTLHDRTQFEIAWTYPYGREPHTRYRIDVYFFLPTAIGVSADTYDPETFFADTQAYIRLATPKVSTRQLIDSGPSAPWPQLEAMVRHASAPTADRAIQRAKLAGCIVRAAIRRQHRKTAQLSQLDDPDKALAKVEESSRNIRALLQRMRDIGVQATAERLLQCFGHIDDALTLASLEMSCDSLALLDDRASGDPAWAPVAESMRAFVSEQEQRRIQKGWPTLAADCQAEQLELFMYRRSQLKKYLFSTLFLRVQRLRSRNLIQHLFGAVAACFAAIWAFFSNPALFGTVTINSLTFAVLFVAVVAYILKDRLKELTRQYLAGRFRRWLPDRDRRVFPPELIPGATRPIGRVREYIDFPASSKIGADVHALRNAVHTIPLGQDSSESVLRYAKIIELWTQPEVRSTTKGIKDILRFNVQHLLTRLDESRDAMTAYDPVARRAVHVEAEHVYHVNMVLRYALITRNPAASKPVLERLRIVLNKSGILRIEPVSLDSAQQQLDDEQGTDEAE